MAVAIGSAGGLVPSSPPRGAFGRRSGFLAPVLLLGVWKHSFGAHTDLVLDQRAVLEAHRENLLRALAADPGGRS